jgi:hypothetical protein
MNDAPISSVRKAEHLDDLRKRTAYEGLRQAASACAVLTTAGAVVQLGLALYSMNERDAGFPIGSLLLAVGLLCLALLGRGIAVAIADRADIEVERWIRAGRPD